ncbi:MAG TPA: tetratricopeptide repeat protein [Terriglobales bacterium]|jgi:tetratricopeptide (TPR) repeat protein
MATTKLFLLALSLAWSSALLAQSSGQTIRHHRIAEVTTSPELTQAESAIEKKDYSLALDLLNKVVAADPKNYAAWFDLGFVSNALGKTDDAIAAYRQSVTAKPDVFESNLNLGLMMARAGQSGADEFLRAATKLTPTSHPEEGKERAWLSLGHVLEKSKPDEAITAFQEAAKLQPKDTEPLLSAGPLLEQQNHIPEAEDAYKQVLVLDPQSADAFTGLANLYMRTKRYPEAQAVLQKLLTLHPDDPSVHLELGRILAANNKPDEAIAELQTAQKTNSNDPALQREIADLLMGQKKYLEAEAQFRLLVKAQPNDPHLHASLGRTLLLQKKYPEAQQELLAAVRLKPDLGEVYGDIAMVADQNKNYPLTIKALDIRAKFLPELPATYFLRATAYDHLHDVKDASANYHRFLDVAKGQFPDQEWQAQHRLIAIEPKK